MSTELTEALDPRIDCAIEWWFVHGFFRDETNRTRAFMTSFFRHRVDIQTPGQMGHSQLFSLLDLTDGGQFSRSRVNSALVDHFLGSRKTAGKINIDQDYIELLMAEIRARGPLRGVQLDDSPVRFQSGPFQIGWRDFRLKHENSGIELNFDDPETALPVRLEMEPASGMIAVDVAGNSWRKGIDVFCRSFPRLRLSGSIGNRRVRGEAWLDHQWGDDVLHQSIGSERRLVGWEWFGLHLEDGSNWLFTVLRNARSRRIISRHLSVQRADGSTHRSSRFRIQPRQTWESPRTRIRYPIQWRMDAPELEARLIFTPYREDQEIPVFGGMRAVWEGAGKITGTFYGSEIQGRGRGEFQGYGYMLDFDRFWKSEVIRVNRRVREFFPGRFTASSFRKDLGPAVRRREPAVLTEMIAGPVWDLLDRGGKRWRPIFTICLLDALGLDPGPFETMVCAISELTHAGSLIVDDIEDSSLLRRGGSCTYIHYGVGPAINAANTVYFLSTLPVFSHPGLTDLQKLEIHRLIMVYHVQAHFGQAQDLQW